MAKQQDSGGSDISQIAIIFLSLFLLGSAALLYAGGGKKMAFNATETATVGQPSVPLPAHFNNEDQLLGALAGHRIAILSGHRGSDSGATCPDGLKEVDVNWQIALKLSQALSQQGAVVDTLTERDTRLQGYRTELFIALHSDSCIDRSGFKAAGRSGRNQAVAKKDIVFLECLQSLYGAATGLHWSQNTISSDMRQYYAIRLVDSHTPAVILEMGFLGGDRHLLLEEQGRVVRGIMLAMGCFFQRTE